MNAFHFECMLRHQLYIYSLKQASTSMKDCEPSQATVLALLKLILMLNEEEKESQEHHVPAGSGLPLHSADKTSAMKSTREKFFGQNNVQTESDRGGPTRTVEGGESPYPPLLSSIEIPRHESEVRSKRKFAASVVDG